MRPAQDPFPPRIEWPESPYRQRRNKLRWQKMGLDDIDLALGGKHPDFPAKELDYQDTLRSCLQRWTGSKHIDPYPCTGPCKQERWGVWCLRIKANGQQMAVLCCLACSYKMRERGLAPDDGQLPLYVDNRNVFPCERCGSIDGVEEHHWAPKHLFTDPWEWPTSFLCPPCHREWHRIVTPNMHRKSA